MRAFGKIAVALSLLMAVPAAAAEPELKTEEQKTVYALGLSIAQSLGSFALTPGEIELVSAGLRDGMANTPKVDLGQYNSLVKELAQKRAASAAEIEKKESLSFLEKIGK